MFHLLIFPTILRSTPPSLHKIHIHVFFLTKNLNKYRGKCGRGYPVYRSLYRTSLTKRMQIFFLGKMNSISISDIFILSCSFLYLACAFIFPSQWRQHLINRRAHFNYISASMHRILYKVGNFFCNKFAFLILKSSIIVK